MAQPSLSEAGPYGLTELDDAATPLVRVRGVLGLYDEHGWELPFIPASEVPTLPTGPAAFTGVSREEVYRGATERRGPDAWKIRQEMASLCGPAAFMYITATHHPQRYWDFATQLFETGDAKIGHLRIKPGTDCKRYRPGARIAAVDWVTLAGIRDSQNAVFDYDDVEDAFAGITMPGELAIWLSMAGYSHVRNETNIYFTKGRGNFLEAIGHHTAGRRVCLFIDAHGIQAADPARGWLRRRFTTPNHWVVLRNVISVKENDVRFEVYTWGDGPRGVWTVPNAPPGQRMSMDTWLQNYYGYVCCKP